MNEIDLRQNSRRSPAGVAWPSGVKVCTSSKNDTTRRRHGRAGAVDFRPDVVPAPNGADRFVKLHRGVYAAPDGGRLPAEVTNRAVVP
jgi:hypothetical protein